MKIILSPYTNPRRDGKINAKDYPYWPWLVELLAPSHELIQIGRSGEKPLVPQTLWDLPMKNLADLVANCDTFIAVDNFMQHFMKCHFPEKPGIVLFGPSDPSLFGYKHNLNLYAGKQYFRHFQFDAWEAQEANDKAHVEPFVVLKALRQLSQKGTPVT